MINFNITVNKAIDSEWNRKYGTIQNVFLERIKSEQTGQNANFYDPLQLGLPFVKQVLESIAIDTADPQWYAHLGQIMTALTRFPSYWYKLNYIYEYGEPELKRCALSYARLLGLSLKEGGVGSPFTYRSGYLGAFSSNLALGLDHDMIMANAYAIDAGELDNPSFEWTVVLSTIFTADQAYYKHGMNPAIVHVSKLAPWWTRSLSDVIMRAETTSTRIHDITIVGWEELPSMLSRMSESEIDAAAVSLAGYSQGKYGGKTAAQVLLGDFEANAVTKKGNTVYIRNDLFAPLCYDHVAGKKPLCVTARLQLVNGKIMFSYDKNASIIKSIPLGIKSAWQMVKKTANLKSALPDGYDPGLYVSMHIGDNFHYMIDSLDVVRSNHATLFSQYVTISNAPGVLNTDFTINDDGDNQLYLPPYMLLNFSVQRKFSVNGFRKLWNHDTNINFINNFINRQPVGRAMDIVVSSRTPINSKFSSVPALTVYTGDLDSGTRSYDDMMPSWMGYQKEVDPIIAIFKDRPRKAAIKRK